MMNWKEFGSGCGLVEVLCQNLPIVTEENHGKSSVSVAGVPAIIRIQHLQYTSVEIYRFSVHDNGNGA
jgi:hypothetical protein